MPGTRMRRAVDGTRLTPTPARTRLKNGKDLSALIATSHEAQNVSHSETDVRAMTVAMILFFMVGFLTCLNDIIIPHLKSIFELNYMQATLVQFAFFSSYFVFSYPGGRSVDWLGYKKTMVLGLLTMATGAAGFIPAS